MRLGLFLLSVLILCFNFSKAQTSDTNRVSPLDSVQIQIDNLEMEIIYSRPFLKGRKFGKDIVPFGKVWRTGANEATIFEISEDVVIEGELLPKGKYSLYTIPDEEMTTIIFNKDWNQWGTVYNEGNDALRISVPTFDSEYSTEQFTISLENSGEVCLSWGEKTFIFHVVCEAD